jgi:ribosomal subunit interface protein
MTIQFNTDNNIKGSDELRAYFSTSISEALSRFGHHITKVEVHLTDENGQKKGQNDKRCLLEAHLTGLPPIAVTNHANTPDQALKGAIDKLKSSLDTSLGRLKDHQEKN